MSWASGISQNASAHRTSSQSNAAAVRRRAQVVAATIATSSVVNHDWKAMNSEMLPSPSKRGRLRSSQLPIGRWRPWSKRACTPK